MKKFLMLLTAVLTSTSAFAQEILYVQSLKAVVYEEPSLGSRQVFTLKKGDRVEQVEKTPDWVKVRFEGKTGWVSTLLVSRTPPLGRVSILERDIDQNIKDTARRRASDYVTAAATRGLLQDRLRVNQKYRVDVESVKWLEKFRFTDQELKTFMETM